MIDEECLLEFHLLARMALHTLYHLPKVLDRRERMEPSFELPHWSKAGSWEHAIEPILHATQP